MPATALVTNLPRLDDSNLLMVGVLGYSDQLFDTEEARDIIRKEYNNLIDRGFLLKIVSGWTAKGVPLIAYQEADRLLLPTVGLGCSKVLSGNYELYPVKESYTYGDNWEDVSQPFVAMCSYFIAIGGGNYIRKEIELIKNAGKNLKVYDLPAITN